MQNECPAYFECQQTILKDLCWPRIQVLWNHEGNQNHQQPQLGDQLPLSLVVVKHRSLLPPTTITVQQVKPHGLGRDKRGCIIWSIEAHLCRATRTKWRDKRFRKILTTFRFILCLFHTYQEIYIIYFCIRERFIEKKKKKTDKCQF